MHPTRRRGKTGWKRFSELMTTFQREGTEIPFTHQLLVTVVVMSIMLGLIWVSTGLIITTNKVSYMEHIR